MTEKQKPDKRLAGTIVGAVAVFLAFAVGFPAYLASTCPAPLTEKPVSYTLSIEGESTIEYRATPKDSARGAAPIPEGAKQKAEGRAEPAEDSGHQQESWWDRFRCDVNSSDYFIALFTLILALVTGFLWWTTHRLWKSGEITAAVAERSSEHFRVTERAYLRMSHVTPEKGVEPALTFDAKGVPRFRVQIKNWGRTPARVLRIGLEIDVRVSDIPLETTPAFQDPGTPRTIFLVPDASFYQPSPFKEPVDVAAIRAETKILYLMGYVDYEDAFRKRHRSTYGRRLVFPTDGSLNNLHFITEGGYNDDFPIDAT